MKKTKIRKALLEYIQGKRYEPMGMMALIRKLGFQKPLHDLCKEILEELIDEGVCTLNKRRLYPVTNRQIIEGQISLHPRGFGFVKCDDRENHPQDVFIPKPLTAFAVDKDRVEIEILDKAPDGKGPEGRVIKILDRGRKHIVAIVTDFEESLSKNKLKDAIAYAPVLGTEKSVQIKRCPKSVKIGDRVLLKVIKWEDDLDYTICEVDKKLGHIDKASADIPIATLEYNLNVSFPKDVVSEAKAFGKTVKPGDSKERIDLTAQRAVTIDPKTAKDFDDALFVQKTKEGFELFVHIADVAHYVKESSQLDSEARKRGNSTYFPTQCIPMLPEELSNELCSLKANVKRLVATVRMEFDLEGELKHYEIMRSVIKSRKRFTYEEAMEVLKGKKKSPHAKTLKTMEELCLLLKAKRRARGSVDLALPELILKIDKSGVPTDYTLSEYDITHQMVEEFMLKANEIVATELTSRGQEAVFRIHDSPSDENIEDFYDLARLLGFKLSKEPTADEIAKLFEEAKSSPHGRQLSIAFIRSMKLAYYSKDNVGHYGLALENYCHFTSPIRRYSDLIVQRLLFAETQTQKVAAIAEECSEKERISFRAETSVLNLKKLRLLKEIYKKEKQARFKAQITKIKPFGLFFDISPFMIEGFVHISRIGPAYYSFDPRDATLSGDTTGEVFTSGQMIEVELINVDLMMQECEYRIIRKKRKR